MEIELTLQPNRGRFLATDGSMRLGKMTFLREGESRIIVDHTIVEEHARGRQVGHALFDHMVQWARDNRIVVAVTCQSTI